MEQTFFRLRMRWAVSTVVVAAALAAAHPSRASAAFHAWALSPSDGPRAGLANDSTVWDGQSASPDSYVRLARFYRSRDTIIDRLRAQRAIEEGLGKYPDDVGLLVELGTTHYEQSLYGDAERVFVRALEIDSECCAARYYLGINAFRKWKHVQNYTNHLTNAIEHLRIAVECPSVARDSFPALAFAAYASGDTTLAVETCVAWMRIQPPVPQPLFLLGSIAYDRGRYEESWKYFQRGIALLPEQDRASYSNFGLLLSPGADEKYEQYGAADQRDAQRAFWLDHDADPTTETNERLLEHIYRVFLSDMRYSSPRLGLKGWETPRGRALIKFGAPDHVRTTLEGIKPSDGRAEWWTYLDAGSALQLQFRDEYLNGNYIVPLWDDISTEALTYEPPFSAQRSSSKEIPCAVDAVAFRSPSGSADVYIVIAADAGSLARSTWSWKIERYVARTAFFEERTVPHAYFADTLASDSLARIPGPRGDQRLLVRRYELPPQAYRAAICVQDDKSLTRALAWSEFDATRFLKRGLELSDLLYCTDPDSAVPVIHRSGSGMLPNPSHAYSGSDNLRIYVEAYNLALADGRSDYELTYSIYPARSTPGRGERLERGLRKLLGMQPPPDAVISQSFRAVAEHDTAGEEVVIDIQVLEPGDYTLSVSVTDRISGESAETSSRFFKLEAPSD